MKKKYFLSCQRKLASSILVPIFLAGCVHSAVMRGAQCEVDKSYVNLQNQATLTGNPDPVLAFQRSDNKIKGVLIGGAAGAIGLSSTFGAVPGAAIGAIVGGAMGAYLDCYSTVIDKLRDRNVKVFILGDQVKFIIPSSQLFCEESAELLYDAQCTLNMIRCVINGWPNMSVQVNAFTGQTFPKAISLALSKQQAQSVARYMWRSGLNTRLLTAEGYGGAQLIAPDTIDCGCNLNSRIEISLEKLPC